MANQPIFVAAYRQNYVTLVAARANEAQDLFTPGASGTRLHAIALANDGEVPALVEFGAYAVVGGDVEVDIAPGTAPDTDPFTVTRAAGAWPALETGLVLTLSKGAVANRGDYKLRARTDTVFTRIDPRRPPCARCRMAVTRRPLRCRVRPGAHGMVRQPGCLPARLCLWNPLASQYRLGHRDGSDCYDGAGTHRRRLVMAPVDLCILLTLSGWLGLRDRPYG